jgi:acyl carrier protein
MRDELRDVLATLFADRGLDVATLRDEDDLREKMAWDSMDFVDLSMEVRQRLQIRLPDDLTAYTLAALVQAAEAARSDAAATAGRG